MLDTLRRLFERFWAWLGGESPTAEAGVAVEPGPGQFVYVVQPGDTLSRIARRFATSVWILADLNDLDNPHLIRVGQCLLIPQAGVPPSSSPVPPSEPGLEPPVEPEPGPFIYIVQTGDQLTTIARRFGVTGEAIVKVNRIEAPDRIRPGQPLLIPGPEPQPEPVSSPPPPMSQPEPEPSLLPASEPEPLPTPPPGPGPGSEQLPLPIPEPEPLPTSPPGSKPPEPPTQPVLQPRPPAPPAPPVSEPKPHPLAGHAYVVRPDDTLTVIAKRFNVTLRAIIEANAIEDPNLIRPGQRLVIPGVAALPQISALRSPLSNLQSPISDLRSVPWPDDAIRGIYVSYFALGHPAHRRHVIDMLTKTEINALVIDAKGDHGWISYPTEVALAHEIGAARPTARDFDELMDLFKANGVYTIARIVTFKDNLLAGAHPEWAAQQEKGGVWHDQAGLAWLDPSVQATWEYTSDLAEEAARRGFDEIQFDCVRFPTPGPEGVPHFSQPLSRASRIAAVTGFLSTARGRLSPLGVRVAANVHGYACWRKDDMAIGQDIERMAQYLDVLCPMLYPSTFGSGIPGYQYAIAHPYEIVYETMKRAVSRVEPLGCQVRPWIQDFPDHRFDRRIYGPNEIQAQMRGSFDGKGTGYMAWNPGVEYTMVAYFPRTSPAGR